MSINIPASAIGSFSSLQQRNHYVEAQKIRKEAEQVAARLRALDGHPLDLNDPTPGSTLIEAHEGLSGLCIFNPHNNEVIKLDAEVITKSQDLKGNRHYRDVKTFQRVRMYQEDDGSKVWATNQGTVRETPEGNLVLDLDRRTGSRREVGEWWIGMDRTPPAPRQHIPGAVYWEGEI